MALSLIAFDTDHIKSYVFGTDRLTEIRGASSLLDRLNRWEMARIARNLRIKEYFPIYTNGGAGLFLVDAQRAQEFGQSVKERYRELSHGRASITFVIQKLPNNITEVKVDNLSKSAMDMLQKFPDYVRPIMTHDLHHELEFMRYHLREEKGSPPDTEIIALPSHPFMRYCDSCGIEYAEQAYRATPDELAEQIGFYCASCREKQREDYRIKTHIPIMVKRLKDKKPLKKEYLWNRILKYMDNAGYDFPADASELKRLNRPSDFNEFRHFAKSKEYLGLIYADANNMGSAMEKLPRLIDIHVSAHCIDENIHHAMSLAIKQHLPIEYIVEGHPSTEESEKEKERVPLFPFDILLLGGDDIVMVTDAAKAMNVALTIAREFHKKAEEQKEQGLIKEVYTLSIGVVLTPVKYPFRLSRELAESALKYAKTEGAKARARGEDDDTRINYVTVTGGSSSDFKQVFNATYHKKVKPRPNKRYTDADSEFYTTLRPFTMKDLQTLLKAISDSKTARLNLGRTKLHQLREAVLEKNLTTAVNEGLALLRNWREKERNYVVQRVYEFGGRYQLQRSNPRDPVSGFPRVTFPWFADGQNDNGQDVYRTPLLDFIELYDFVDREGLESSDEN